MLFKLINIWRAHTLRRWFLCYMDWPTCETNHHTFQKTHSSRATYDNALTSVLRKFRNFSLKHKGQQRYLIEADFQGFIRATPVPQDQGKAKINSLPLCVNADIGSISVSRNTKQHCVFGEWFCIAAKPWSHPAPLGWKIWKVSLFPRK